MKPRMLHFIAARLRRASRQFPWRRTMMAASCLLLAACSTVQAGRNFDVHAFEARVQRGTTTEAVVRAWLGAPSNTGISVDTGGERYDEWTYFFASGTLPDMSNAKVKILQIKFDAQGIVRGYNWSASEQ